MQARESSFVCVQEQDVEKKKKKKERSKIGKFDAQQIFHFKGYKKKFKTTITARLPGGE